MGFSIEHKLVEVDQVVVGENEIKVPKIYSLKYVAENIIYY